MLLQVVQSLNERLFTTHPDQPHTQILLLNAGNIWITQVWCRREGRGGGWCHAGVTSPFQ